MANIILAFLPASIYKCPSLSYHHRHVSSPSFISRPFPRLVIKYRAQEGKHFTTHPCQLSRSRIPFTASFTNLCLATIFMSLNAELTTLIAYMLPQPPDVSSTSKLAISFNLADEERVVKSSSSGLERWGGGMRVE